MTETWVLIIWLVMPRSAGWNSGALATTSVPGFTNEGNCHQASIDTLLKNQDSGTKMFTICVKQ